MNYSPDTKEKFDIVVNTYRLLGFKETLKEVALYLLSQRPEDDFDEKYHVTTSGCDEGPSASSITDETARAFSVGYAPTRECVMRHILNNALRKTNTEEYSFVDLGCGKGRTLIIAAQFPFQEVVGVELSPLHYQVAADNIERYRLLGSSMRCKSLRAVCANAAEFVFPSTNLLIYMYRPFLGPVFKSVLDKLYGFHAATGHQVLVAYSCPVEQDFLEQHGGFVKRKEYQVISTDYSWNLWECQAH